MKNFIFYFLSQFIAALIIFGGVYIISIKKLNPTPKRKSYEAVLKYFYYHLIFVFIETRSIFYFSAGYRIFVGCVFILYLIKLQEIIKAD